MNKFLEGLRFTFGAVVVGLIFAAVVFVSFEAGKKTQHKKDAAFIQWHWEQEHKSQKTRGIPVPEGAQPIGVI